MREFSASSKIWLSREGEQPSNRSIPRRRLARSKISEGMFNNNVAVKKPPLIGPMLPCSVLPMLYKDSAFSQTKKSVTAGLIIEL